MTVIERVFYAYVHAYFTHQRAKQAAKDATEREEQTRCDYQEQWRKLRGLPDITPKPGVHIVNYQGEIYGVYFGAGDYQIPTPIVGGRQNG